MTWTIVVFLNAQFNTASEVLFQLFNGFTPSSITLNSYPSLSDGASIPGHISGNVRLGEPSFGFFAMKEEL